jgi:hypothetical protein
MEERSKKSAAEYQDRRQVAAMMKMVGTWQVLNRKKLFSHLT